MTHSITTVQPKLQADTGNRAQVSDLSKAGIAGSNPADDMDVRLLFFFTCGEGSGLCDEIITR